MRRLGGTNRQQISRPVYALCQLSGNPIRTPPRGPADARGTTKMAIADIAAGVQSTAPGRTCTVCWALDTIPETEAAALREVLANKGVRYSDLSLKLAADPDTPLVLDPYTLSRHARGICQARERLR